MSESKKLNSLSVVTSLGSGEYLLATDAQGNARRISKTNGARQVMEIACKEACWIRIAEFNQAGNSIISISNGWSSLTGGYALIAGMYHASAAYNKVSVLANLSNYNAVNPVYKKIRSVCKSGSVGYVDFWYPGSSGNQNVIVEMIGARNMNLVTPEIDASIPEGYTSVEFDLTVGGG